MTIRLLALLTTTTLLSAAPTPTIYSELSNPLQPTWRDYQHLQTYIQRGERPELKLLTQAIAPGGALHDYNCRARRFRLIGKWPWQRPQFGVIAYQCPLSDKRIAICTYASYNHNYPKGIAHLKKALQAIGFKGHFIYRIGGWPDVEGGSLKLAHVPYAFKPCFLRELQRLGYETVLWLDASIRPKTNLQGVFETIQTQGYLFYSAGHCVAQYCSPQAARALGETATSLEHIDSIAAGIFGVNLRHPIGQAIAEKWYAAAEQQTPFLSPRPEQTALSILLHQMNLHKREEPHTLAWQKEMCNAATLFFIDWASVR